MEYLDFAPLMRELGDLKSYFDLKCEYGSADALRPIYDQLKQALADAQRAYDAVPPDAALAAKEPDGYDAIEALCEGGNTAVPVENLNEKMAGAVLGRFIGCLLGVPVEGYAIERMKKIAAHCGMEFPPRGYWREVERPWDKQYGDSPRTGYREGSMNCVCCDDDITYTILGLLVIEKYGFDFTTAQVGEFWKAHLPMACTAEHVTLENLKAGIPAEQAADLNNPYVQWIGADIRADGFAFAAAGNPHLAAKLAYRDAYLSHRRNGIYGEMFFAAAEAAAFTVADPMDAIRMGLREIPRECELHKAIEWALETAPAIHDYAEARAAVDERFAGMHAVHTINNACLVVFGLQIGKGSFTDTISEVVAMGLDNDCTGATAGSILGAFVGRSGIDAHWTAHFNDTVRTYLTGFETLSISDVTARFVALASNQPAN